MNMTYKRHQDEEWYNDQEGKLLDNGQFLLQKLVPQHINVNYSRFIVNN